jgi:thiol-disulfide isomerase/thioredoxin
MIKKDVQELQTKIQEKENAYVLFYASWCPFSQRFLPIFQEYAKTNPDECVEVVIDEKPDVCDEYSIEYYPTVLCFRKGKVHKRLDSEPHVGLTKSQLQKFTQKS